MRKPIITLAVTEKGNTRILVNGHTNRIVDAEASIVEALEGVERDLTSNLQTHTGKVHAPGRYDSSLKTNTPRCCASRSAARKLHYLLPVSGPVTCGHCLTALERDAQAPR